MACFMVGSGREAPDWPPDSGHSARKPAIFWGEPAPTNPRPLFPPPATNTTPFASNVASNDSRPFKRLAAVHRSAALALLYRRQNRRSVFGRPTKNHNRLALSCIGSRRDEPGQSTQDLFRIERR